MEEIDEMSNKENSPFWPGLPVPMQFFAGRSKQVNELIRYLRHMLSGKQENVFLVGDRGVGKSSLACFLRYSFINNADILGLHVFLATVSTLEEMVRHIFDHLLKETEGQSCFPSIAQYFGDHIRQPGCGCSLSFSPSEEESRRLVRNFPEAIHNVVEKVKEEKRGLFIALDDIHGLAVKKEFASWYKSLVDDIAIHYQGFFPVLIMPIGLPEERDSLSALEPSLSRVFRIVEVGKLSNDEVAVFLADAFEKSGVSVEPEAMKLMVQYSNGFPMFMHEIGDAIYLCDEDGVIDRHDAYRGIMSAATIIGNKYNDPGASQKVRRRDYESLVKQLGQIPIYPRKM